jgi:predicted nucleotidyltransferase
MKLMEIAVPYHKELNPKLWDGTKLRPEVRTKLLEIVKEFIKFCDIPDFHPDLVYMTGSLCAFNYTSGSDIDVHIKLSFDDFDCPEMAEELFDAKRDVFTDKFDISIYGFPVEVYVQDHSDENIAAGEYDLIKDTWIEKPKYSPPDINSRDIQQRIKSMKRKINKVISKDADYDEAKGLMKRIKAIRKAALEDGGEFSAENLAFKALRKDGSIAKLLDHIKAAKSEELSLE